MIVTCNKLAMTSLSTESYKECHMFLKRAELLIIGNNSKSEHIQKLYSLTMNNMGCYYKK